MINDPSSYSTTTWTGTAADDILIWEYGDDVIDGGDGSDTLSINRNSSGVTVSTNSANITYINIADTYNSHDLTVTNVEKVAFNDNSYYLDLRIKGPTNSDEESSAISPSPFYSTHSIDENSQSVFTFNANRTVNWSISGGVDADLFSIDQDNGKLIFIDLPDYEIPIDNDIDNIYIVEVTAKDLSNNTAHQEITISVNDIDDRSPRIIDQSDTYGNLKSTGLVPENNTSIHVYTADESVTWNLIGGEDLSLFDINKSSGELSFINNPDFENPLDVDKDNVYKVIIEATDIAGNSSSQELEIYVDDIDEIPPEISLGISSDLDNSNVLEVEENLSEIVTLIANEEVTWSISSGQDSILFDIDENSGNLIFKEFAPDYEYPTDNDGNNQYEVDIKAEDRTGNISYQELVISITDVDDNDYLLGILENDIYRYEGVAYTDNNAWYTFELEEEANIYFDLYGLAYDLDLKLYPYGWYSDDDIIALSDAAGIEEESFFKSLDKGKYDLLIESYDPVYTSDSTYKLEIDLSSFSQNTILPNDPKFESQWHLFNTGQSDGIDNIDIYAPEAWKIRNTSEEIVVAIIDTGIDYYHPDLDDNIWINANEIPNNNLDDDDNGYVDDYYGWDFYSGDNDPMDYMDHGTHVAGIVGAEGNNGIGVAGISWDVQLMALKVFSDDSDVDDKAKNIYDAIRYATDNGADIINLSLGYVVEDYSFEEFKQYYPSNYNAYNAALNYAAINGVLIVSALGNDEKDTEINSSIPADFSVEVPGMISVAAINNKGDLSNFSNHGNLATIGAPGGQLDENATQNILSTVPGGQYDYMPGTSMSSPIVAGAAALLLAQDPTLTPTQVKELLLDQAASRKELEDLIPGGKYLDIYSALSSLTNVSESESTSEIPVIKIATVNNDYTPDPKGFASINSSTPVIVTAYEVGTETTLDSIKDYDGNLHAGDNLEETASSYKYQGMLDVNGDGVFEAIFTNKVSKRWVTAKVDSTTGQIDFNDNGAGGGTRVVGIYEDPLIAEGADNGGFLSDGVTPAPANFGVSEEERYVEVNGETIDRLALNSQVRFQNDLDIDNLSAKHSGDYDSDGVSEVYWKTNDGTAFLRALMHDDGNIRYANYQSEEQMGEYLTAQGHESVIPEII